MLHYFEGDMGDMIMMVDESGLLEDFDFLEEEKE